MEIEGSSRKKEVRGEGREDRKEEKVTKPRPEIYMYANASGWPINLYKQYINRKALAEVLKLWKEEK